MKKSFILVVFFTQLIGSVFSQTGIELDNENGTSMKPIINEMNDVVEALETDSLEIVHIEFDLLFADHTREIVRTLSSGYNYAVFLYGDYRIKQAGINLYRLNDDTWSWVKSGTVDSESNTTSLMINVEETGQYKIELTANTMQEGYTVGHYALYLMHN
jgi:hypothetical protein